MNVGGHGQNVEPRIILISHWAITMARTSLRLVTTSISAMRVSLERLTRSVLVQSAPRTAHSSQAFFGTSVANGVGVMINSGGKLGTVVSSARFKDNIKSMDKVSEAILALKPVTFRYKKELDPDGIPPFGLVAEQVEKVNPDLIVRDDEGKVMSVRYQAVNAMLLNEFLKEHHKVEEQQATITELESKVAKQELTATQQQKQIEALTATIQKVSDQVVLSKPAPQLVANP